MNTTTDKDLLALARTILEGTSINEAREYEPEENAKVCHFQFIADTIKGMPSHSASLRSAKISVANSFADALAATNEKFNRDLFLKACGVSPYSADKEKSEK